MASPCKVYKKMFGLDFKSYVPSLRFLILTFWLAQSISIYIRRRLTYLIFHGIYILFVDFFWSWNTFWFFSSLFVGLSFIIFLIRFTNNFWFYFCHFEALLRQKIKTKEQRFCGINYFLAKNKHKMPKCCYILVKTGMGKSI